MAGLSDATISVLSNHLIVATDFFATSVTAEKEILSLVPAAFGLVTDVNQVTLEIAGLKLYRSSGKSLLSWTLRNHPQSSATWPH